MDKYELANIVVYFVLFVGSDIWLFVTLIIVIKDMFKGSIEIDANGKILAIVALVLISISIPVIAPLFIILIITDDPIYYEYLIPISFIASMASVLTNMAIAKLQSNKMIFEEERLNPIISTLNMIDIFSLSTSFIFAGACGFFYSKRLK